MGNGFFDNHSFLGGLFDLDRDGSLDLGKAGLIGGLGMMYADTLNRAAEEAELENSSREDEDNSSDRYSWEDEGDNGDTYEWDDGYTSYSAHSWNDDDDVADYDGASSRYWEDDTASNDGATSHYWDDDDADSHSQEGDNPDGPKSHGAVDYRDYLNQGTSTRFDYGVRDEDFDFNEDW